LHKKYPCRRNIELPQAEFSIPLTILGYPKYPQNPLEWIKAVTTICLQIITVKSYKHILVLEIPNNKEKIYKYWTNILKPTQIINVNQNLLSTDKKELEHFTKVLFKTKLKKYGIDEETIAEQIQNLRLPLSKIKIMKGRNHSTIIDSTHYYYPIPLISVLEVATAMKGNKILIHDNAETKLINTLTDSNWSLNPKNYTPQSNDVILIRGKKTQMDKHVKNLTGSRN